MTYPADVQAALDYAATEGWTKERYQAVLSIALHHLETPVLPEIVVMYAEDPVPFMVMGHKRTGDGLEYTEVEGTIPAGQIYFVCPVCCRRTMPMFQQEAVESASVEWEESGADDDQFAIYAHRDGWDADGGDTAWLTCNSPGCFANLGWPEFLDFTD